MTTTLLQIHQEDPRLNSKSGLPVAVS